MFLWYPVMDLARAPRRAPLTARKKGSGYENGLLPVDVPITTAKRMFRPAES